MITQQPEQEIQQKAQAPSPVKQHRWVVVLLSIIGVALPLVAGSMLYWPWLSDFMDLQGVLTTEFLAAGVSMTVGAFLLCFAFRSWRVAVFAAVAWVVGEFLSSLVRTLVEGSSSLLLSWEFFWNGEIGLIVIAMVPLLLCVALGAAGALALGKWRASRQ